MNIIIKIAPKSGTKDNLIKKMKQKLQKVIHNQKMPTAAYQKSVLRINAHRKWQKIDVSKENKPSENAKKAPKVLIVEDNQFNVYPIQSTLTRNNIEYHLAKNGLMAVDRFNEAMKARYFFP